jgi:hypothetical protein
MRRNHVATPNKQNDKLVCLSLRHALGSVALEMHPNIDRKVLEMTKQHGGSAGARGSTGGATGRTGGPTGGARPAKARVVDVNTPCPVKYTLLYCILRKIC